MKERVAHADTQGHQADVRAALRGSIAASGALSGLEESLWILRDAGRFYVGQLSDAGRTYSRTVREGNASISTEFADVFQRLGFSADGWQARLSPLTE